MSKYEVVVVALDRNIKSKLCTKVVLSMEIARSKRDLCERDM